MRNDMNYNFFERALIQPIIDVNTSLEVYAQNKTSSKLVLIYTFLRESDKSVKIGFTNNLCDSDIESSLGIKDYKLIGKRIGSKREYRLLLITLNELGYKYNINDLTYNYSSKLIKHLKLLGWPINSLNKSIKKIYASNR